MDELHALQRFTSEIFWHFTGSHRKPEDVAYANLLSILRSGLKRGPENEKIPFMSLDDPQRVVYEEGLRIAALTDMPLKDLPVHAARYGPLALGFHKRSAIDAGFLPVWYVNQPSEPLADLRRRMRAVERRIAGAGDAALAEEFAGLSVRLRSFIKPGYMKRPLTADEELDRYQANNYYYEREWRRLDDWDFSAEDVAIVLLPRARMRSFDEARRREPLRVSPETVVLPFELLRSL